MSRKRWLGLMVAAFASVVTTGEPQDRDHWPDGFPKFHVALRERMSPTPALELGQQTIEAAPSESDGHLCAISCPNSSCSVVCRDDHRCFKQCNIFSRAFCDCYPNP